MNFLQPAQAGAQLLSLMGAASGVTWLILGFYVPLLVVSLALIIWQLYSRRGEPLTGEEPRTIVLQ